MTTTPSNVMRSVYPEKIPEVILFAKVSLLSTCPFFGGPLPHQSPIKARCLGEVVADKCLKCWTFWRYLLINRAFLRTRGALGF